MGNQLDVLSFCDLKRPSKAASISSREKAHIAEPGIALVGVVKTAYIKAMPLVPSDASMIPLVASKKIFKRKLKALSMQLLVNHSIYKAI